MTPSQIASSVRASIQAVRSVFPEVRVGSIEIAGMDADEVAAWLDAYRQATGEDLAYFHLDADYDRPDWAARAKRIEDVVRSRGVPFGIIYTGAQSDATDAAWIEHAQQRVVEYEVDTGGNPDHAVFQSWHQHPAKLLPETAADAFTHLIDLYLRQRTRLTADRDGATLRGVLTTTDQTPLAAAALEVLALPIDGPGAVHTYTLSGTVPAGSHAADVGYRINTECDCSGPATVTLYRAEFRQDGGSNRVPNANFGHGLDQWGVWGSALTQVVHSDLGPGSAVQVGATASQDAGLNSGVFPVEPGAPFTLAFTARVQPQTSHSGYFDVVFLDGDNEVDRMRIPITSVAVPAGHAETGADGTFRLMLAPDVPAKAVLVIRFEGDEKSWPAAATIGG
jgi:hypothetical protein